MRDGRVLVTGGSADGRVHRSAEAFDPRTGRFRRVAPMTLARHKHAAVTLRDGRVLVVGGSDARDFRGRYASAELFLAGRGRFVRTGGMAARRFKLPAAVVRLADGRVLVAGGAVATEAYEPRTGRFRGEPGRLDTGRSFSTATALRDGRVLVAGGYDDRITSTPRAWLVTP
jgi:hypothetical protein